MGLRTWLRRFLGPEPPRPPRLVDLELALDELGTKVDWLTADFKKLRGRVTGGLKKSAQESETAVSPADTDDGDAPQALQHHPTGSAHLAARFRRF